MSEADIEEAVQNMVMDSYTSFREDGILDDVLKQMRNVSWVIALIRQLNAMCRQLGLLETSESLSIQHLINNIEKHLRNRNGAIYELESAASILMEEGVVLDTILPLTYSLDEKNPVSETMVTKIQVGEVIVHHLTAYESVNAFEHRLKQILESCPVTISMLRYRSFDNIIGDEIYFQKRDERVLNSRHPDFYHVMLATGAGVHYEVPFSELQDSDGIERGSQGFIRVALDIGQIHHFVEMKNPIKVTERFTQKRLENFFDSNSCEKILYKLDVVAKKSQARLLLADQNLITDNERNLILRKLDYMKREIMANKYPYGIHGEDVCKNNEVNLAKLIGVELNTKFHTTLNTVEYRITVYKLWCLSASDFLVSGIRKLQQTLVNVALKNRKLLVPICVPAQKVQLPSLPHVFLAFVEKLECDVSRYTNFLSRLDSSSVGGYEDRDFVLEFLFVNSNTAIHISDLEDVWSLWFSSEFSPQDRNDINDSPKVMCSLMSALTLSQRIPFGSNRIFQDFKDCLFSSMKKTATMINNSVKFSLALSSDLAFNQEKINQSIQPRYINELMKCVPLELKCVDEQLSNWEEKLKTT